MVRISIAGVAAAALTAAGLSLLGPVSIASADAPFTAELDWGTFTLNETTAEKVRNGEELKFRYVAAVPEAPAHRPVRKGFQAASDEHGYDHGFVGPEGGPNPQEQASIIESLIRAGTDALIINCDGADVLTPVVNAAVDAGIPTLTSNIDCPASKRFSYHGQDLVNSGRVAGTQFNKYFRETHPEGGGPYKVGLFGGDSAYDYVRDRIAGFKEMVAADDIEFIGIFDTTFDFNKVYNVVESTFRANPDMDGIYMVDEGILGGGQYIKRHDLSGSVTAVGFNFIPGIPELIEAGAVQASIGQYLYKQGWNPVVELHAFFNGKAPDCELCDVGADILNSENIVERLPQLREAEEKAE